MAELAGVAALDDPLEVGEQVHEHACKQLTGSLAASTAACYQREWERWLWACSC